MGAAVGADAGQSKLLAQSGRSLLRAITSGTVRVHHIRYDAEFLKSVTLSVCIVCLHKTLDKIKVSNSIKEIRSRMRRAFFCGIFMGVLRKIDLQARQIGVVT